MTEKATCSRCGRFFQNVASARQHIHAKHGGNGKPLPIVPQEQEESMADIFVQAEMDRACGLPVEDWIKDMLR